MTQNPFFSSHQETKRINDITKIPFTLRTTEEVRFLTKVLSEFDFIQKKVSNERVPEALSISTKYLEHIAIPKGEFLCHFGINFTLHFILRDFLLSFRGPVRLHFLHCFWRSLGVQREDRY